MKNTKKGFTLVELLVVIAILAILASVAVVGYTAFIDRAKESNAKTEAMQIIRAIEAVLLVDKEVEVGDGIIIVKGNDGGYAIGTDDAEFTHDVLEDILPEGATLTDENDVLVYDNGEVKVNVFTNEVIPQ